MHGRLKVRSTEEQEERRRLEREKKLKQYQAGMEMCLSKMHAHDYDKSGLAVSGEILSANPDVQTLWGLRKNIILAMLDTPTPPTQQPSGEESANEDVDKKRIEMFEYELALTETCLKRNPKSYSTWFHRQWCLKKANDMGLGEKCARLSWKNELALCSLFLKMDERNFHSWKHRFFVVDNGKLSKQDELEFTREKIEENFSNYSAWHYRSKLIEELSIDGDGGGSSLDTSVFKRELDLIENAAATDPNDQSAWIYERWLLIRHKECFVRDSALTDAHIKSLVDLLGLEGGRSKWIMLTLIELMTVRGESLEDAHKKVITGYLDILANELDVYRKNYYIFLKNKFC